MHWKKLGNIFNSTGEHDWMTSHASAPIAEYIKDDLFRVYFSSRNNHNQSYISFVDLELKPPYKIISIHHKPVLSPGEIGLFDDSGVVTGCILNIENKKYLYYLGWNLGVTVPWRNSIGHSVWNNEKQIFEKTSRAPLLDRSNEDPFSISYPSIIFEDGIYKMWYGSNLSWGKEQHEMKHVIKYATSKDGIRWNRNNETVINLEHENEYAIAKPCVRKINDKYYMWYSYRASGNITTYRIGLAISNDGFIWKRIDPEVGIDVSKDGWDSEMISYAFIFEHHNKYYMLYNGNGYGKTGFGLAVLKSF